MGVGRGWAKFTLKKIQKQRLLLLSLDIVMTTGCDVWNVSSHLLTMRG